jgi:kynurenine formamidase
MAGTTYPSETISVEDFEAIFESVKNWGRWGADDIMGTLNLIKPEHVVHAASLVRTGKSISMAIEVNTVAGPDNASPAIHHMTLNHDIDIKSGKVRFSMDFIGMACHGDCHTHIDALNHVSYDGKLYGGRSVDTVTSVGAQVLVMDDYANGIVGRGVLLDVPRFRGVPYLEPGEAVTRAELEAVEEAQGVRVGEGDLFVYRTGHHRRRRELGAWDNGYDGEGKAGLHPDTIPWMHERGVAGFLPDGDGEAIPSKVDGILYPIHPLQIVAMGMMVSDSLNLEEVADQCAAEGRHEFLVVASALRVRGGTGSPFNPIAIF